MHELGGGTYTLAQQIAANELGLPLEMVRVELGDSDFAVNGVAGGSTQAASFGSAVLDVCRRARSELIRAAMGEEQTLAGGNTSTREFCRSGAAKQVGFVRDDFARASFGAQFVEVAVHALTGEVRVPHMLGTFAFGRVLNERTARHQLTGGMIWGVGSVRHEATELDHRHARYVNSNLGEYLIPVNADVPQVEALIVEELDEHVSPLGAKGVGELGITGVNAADANAVHHATGVRLREVPIRMEHLIG